LAPAAIHFWELVAWNIYLYNIYIYTYIYIYISMYVCVYQHICIDSRIEANVFEVVVLAARADALSGVGGAEYNIYMYVYEYV